MGRVSFSLPFGIYTPSDWAYRNFIRERFTADSKKVKKAYKASFSDYKRGYVNERC